MPNWTDNEIYVEGDKDTLKAFLAAVGNEDQALDFNRIVPRPAIMDRTNSGSTMIDGVQVSSWITGEGGAFRLPTPEETADLKEIGSDNWYDWCVQHWGTKWNASNVEMDDTSEFGYVSIEFQTAWCEPKPIFIKLREMFPTLEFRFGWRYEDDDRWPHNM